MRLPMESDSDAAHATFRAPEPTHHRLTHDPDSDDRRLAEDFLRTRSETAFLRLYDRHAGGFYRASRPGYPAARVWSPRN